MTAQRGDFVPPRVRPEEPAVTAPEGVAARLDELEALHAAATPGPWATYWGTRIAAGVDQRSSGGVTVENYIGEVADEDDRADYDNSPNPASPSADAKLIVAAVNALPDLIAAVRAVAAECQALISADSLVLNESTQATRRSARRVLAALTSALSGRDDHTEEAGR